MNKVIFSDGHFISRSKENYISYMYSNPALIFNFEHEQMIVLQNKTIDFRKEGLSFVLENLRAADGKRLEQFNSIHESSPSLRSLISSHQGEIRVRELTSAEQKEIEAFKKASEGTDLIRNFLHFLHRTFI